MHPLLTSFDCFLLDLDGVVYVGGDPVPGSPETVNALRTLGKSCRFVSNDPRGSRAEYCRKLQGMGIRVEENDVLTAGWAAGWYLRHFGLAGRTALVVGSEALRAEIAAAGLPPVEGDPGRRAQVVVVGGHDGFGYRDLRIAGEAVRRGAFLLGTSRDATFPMPDGLWPATGPLLAAVEEAGGAHALVVGKPEPWLFRSALSRLPAGTRAVVIGDRLDSDILGAQRAGLPGALVLSGATRVEDLQRSRIRPEFVLENLAEIVRCR